jgi:hypothetical protein
MKAGQVRLLAARLPVLIEQEWAQSAEPDTRRLEKIARYEAHLERVLYRALHELEAAQRGREGQDTPGPLRMVLEVPQHDREEGVHSGSDGLGSAGRPQDAERPDCQY